MSTKTILEVLQKSAAIFGSIFQFEMTSENTLVLDFSEKNQDLTSQIIEDAATQEKYVFEIIKKANALVGVGGYNEERVIYQRSSMFNNSSNPRYIHLGIDLWIEVNTPIYAPLDGIIYSLKNNEGFGDYGPTIILKHEIENLVFFSLYGHLSQKSITHKKVGDKISRGDLLSWVGNYPVNGDWAPHLHFQIMTDMLDYDGDFIGVCSLAEREKFLQLCPDPNLILKIPNL